MRCDMNASTPTLIPLRQHRLLGVLPLVFYALHTVKHVHAGDPGNMLWACHLSNLLIGAGLLANWRAGVAAGLLWLSVGVPLWIGWLTGGGDFSITSALTHVGGVAVGVWAIRRMSWPRGVWWKAWLAIPLLQLICRLTTPSELNVNIAHKVWEGWEQTFPSYPLYLALLLGATATIFVVVEQGFRRLPFLQPPTPTANVDD